jgi:hypothetical protein
MVESDFGDTDEHRTRQGLDRCGSQPLRGMVRRRRSIRQALALGFSAAIDSHQSTQGHRAASDRLMVVDGFISESFGR